MKTPVDRYHVIFNVNCNNVFCFFLNELLNDIKKFGIWVTFILVAMETAQIV